VKNKAKELEELLELEQDTREAMLNMLEDLEEQKNNIESSHKEWIDAFDALDDAVMLHDKDNNIMRVNKAYKDLAGAEKFKYIIGKPYFHSFPKQKGPMATCLHSINSGAMAEEEFRHSDGRVFRSRTYPIFGEDSEYSYGIHIFEDITKEKAQESHIYELNKTLRLISTCNEILVRSTTENELISKISNEIIEKDVYDFIGVYFIEEESIRCNYYLLAQGELHNINTVNLLDGKYKDCPVVECIEKNKVITINDIKNDEKWYDILESAKDICPASEFGMEGSMIFLPLYSEEMIGSMVIYSKDIDTFDEDKTSLFVELSEDTAYGIHTLRLREDFLKTSQQRDESLLNLKSTFNETVQSIAMMVEARDPYTAGHQTRVSDLAVTIAKELELDVDMIEGIKIASQIHDIGKIKIPSEVLSKPGKISDLEFEMIKTHSTTGYEILKNINFPWPVATIVHQHHEKLDKSGYPNALGGDEILLEAKILCVADVVEAIASHRPYRASLGLKYALEEIEKDRGLKYDEKVVDACLKIFREDNYELL